MAQNSILRKILEKIIAAKDTSNETFAVRRQRYRNYLTKIERVLAERWEKIITQIWTIMEEDEEAWDTSNPFESVQEEFPRTFNFVSNYRNMNLRAAGSLKTIARHWPNDYRQFAEMRYDLLKYVSQCSKERSFAWCAAKILQIIEKRTANSRRGISKNPQMQNSDWQDLSELIKRENLAALKLLQNPTILSSIRPSSSVAHLSASTPTNGQPACRWQCAANGSSKAWNFHWAR